MNDIYISPVKSSSPLLIRIAYGGVCSQSEEAKLNLKDSRCEGTSISHVSLSKATESTFTRRKPQRKVSVKTNRKQKSFAESTKSDKSIPSKSKLTLDVLSQKPRAKTNTKMDIMPTNLSASSTIAPNRSESDYLMFKLNQDEIISSDSSSSFLFNSRSTKWKTADEFNTSTSFTDYCSDCETTQEQEIFKPSFIRNAFGSFSKFGFRFTPNVMFSDIKTRLSNFMGSDYMKEQGINTETAQTVSAANTTCLKHPPGSEHHKGKSHKKKHHKHKDKKNKKEKKMRKMDSVEMLLSLGDPSGRSLKLNKSQKTTPEDEPRIKPTTEDEEEEINSNERDSLEDILEYGKLTGIPGIVTPAVDKQITFNTNTDFKKSEIIKKLKFSQSVSIDANLVEDFQQNMKTIIIMEDKYIQPSETCTETSLCWDKDFLEDFRPPPPTKNATQSVPNTNKNLLESLQKLKEGLTRSLHAGQLQSVTSFNTERSIKTVDRTEASSRSIKQFFKQDSDILNEYSRLSLKGSGTNYDEFKSRLLLDKSRVSVKGPSVVKHENIIRSVIPESVPISEKEVETEPEVVESEAVETEDFEVREVIEEASQSSLEFSSSFTSTSTSSSSEDAELRQIDE